MNFFMNLWTMLKESFFFRSQEDVIEKPSLNKKVLLLVSYRGIETF